jgi:hypothetical protein
LSTEEDRKLARLQVSAKAAAAMALLGQNGATEALR